MVDLTPDNLIIWIAVGGAVGWLAEAVVKRRRFGNLADVALGVFGGVAGALALNERGLPFEVYSYRTEQALMAMIGAVAVIVLVSLFERLT